MLKRTMKSFLVPPKNLKMEIKPEKVEENQPFTVECHSSNAVPESSFVYGKQT